MNFPKVLILLVLLFKNFIINENIFISEAEAEVDSIEDTGTLINNSLDKLKKIIGELMTSNDPTQVQLNFMLLACVLEILFSVTILLCRHRLGR